jgi:hypothetical protein
VALTTRTVDAPPGTKDGRGRISVGWGRRGRREEEGEISDPHQFARRRGAVSRERNVREHEALGFVSSRFRRVWDRKQGTHWVEFGSVRLEFGPNSRPSFHATPNAGIRVPILEFRILSPIPYIQTEPICIFQEFTKTFTKRSVELGDRKLKNRATTFQLLPCQF